MSQPRWHLVLAGLTALLCAPPALTQAGAQQIIIEQPMRPDPACREARQEAREAQRDLRAEERMAERDLRSAETRREAREALRDGDRAVSQAERDAARAARRADRLC